MSNVYLGQILMFGGSFAPRGFAFCNGQLLSIAQNTALFSLLGTYYGGNGQTTFALPNLQSSLPIHMGQGLGLSEYQIGQSGGSPTVTITQATMPTHNHTFNATAATATQNAIATNSLTAQPTVGTPTPHFYVHNICGQPPVTPVALNPSVCGPAGGSQPHSNLMPSVASRSSLPPPASFRRAIEEIAMDPYVGEIRSFGFNFAPIGWALCSGQLLPIDQYQALFAIIGTTYGGNGTTNFAVPNLQGSVPMHWGTSPGFNTVLGEVQGTPSVTLMSMQIPMHVHTIYAGAAGGPGETVAIPASDSYLASSPPPNKAWKTTPTTFTAPFSPRAISPNGGSQPHENRQPFLVLNFCIAFEGIFPSPN